MTDCPNAEIRDQLPDLLHDRLPVSARDVVLAHIDECVDCRDELELLRCVHGLLVTHRAQVDVASVVSALPKPPVRTTAVTPIAARRRTWVDWRIAAAVTFLAVGGASVAIVNRDNPTPGARGAFVVDSPATSVLSPSLGTSSSGTPTVATAEPTTAAGGLQMGGRLADLDDLQLQALLDDIEQMKAVPITEPEPVTIKVDSKITLPEDEGT